MFRGHRPTDNWKVPFEQADMYFQVGKQKTYNRNQAIVWANGDTDKINLYWMNEVWDQIDWTTPPSRSWTDLMRERCWQVRDKADVLGVSYSGGYDSQTIVDHMIINRVPLDELQINVKRYHPHPEGETTPILAQKIKDKYYPNLKVRAIEIGLDYLLNIYRNYGEDWLFKQDTGRLHFTQTVRSSQINHNQEHTRLLDTRNIVMCEGIEKPRLFIKDGWWVTGYHDDCLIHVMNTPYEHFYVSRDLPELHVKQVWMMVDWMESQPYTNIQDLEEFMHSVQKHENNHTYEAWNLAVGRNPVHHLNSWAMEFNQKKSGVGGMYSMDAQSTLNYNKIWDLPEVKMWKATAEKFIQQYNTAFVSESGNTKHIWTKLYPIKPVEPKRTMGSVFLH
jgi:hypothetical protein